MHSCRDTPRGTNPAGTHPDGTNPRGHSPVEQIPLGQIPHAGSQGLPCLRSQSRPPHAPILPHSSSPTPILHQSPPLQPQPIRRAPTPPPDPGPSPLVPQIQPRRRRSSPRPSPDAAALAPSASRYLQVPRDELIFLLRAGRGLHGGGCKAGHAVTGAPVRPGSPRFSPVPLPCSTDLPRVASAPLGARLPRLRPAERRAADAGWERGALLQSESASRGEEPALRQSEGASRLCGRGLGAVKMAAGERLSRQARPGRGRCFASAQFNSPSFILGGFTPFLSGARRAPCVGVGREEEPGAGRAGPRLGAVPLRRRLGGAR